MRRCFYGTDLRQNALFHNLSRQIALIQYSEPYEAPGRSTRGLLTSAKFSMNIKRVMLQHNKVFIVFIIFFI